jgi:hypothetical protein
VAKLTDRLRTMTGRKSPTAETDQAALLADLSQAFAGVVARSELSRLLVSRVTEALGLREAALLLPRDEGSLALEESFGWAVEGRGAPGLSRRGTIAEGSPGRRPISGAEGSVPTPGTQERWWLARPEARLWVPWSNEAPRTRHPGKARGLLIPIARPPGFDREERRTIQAYLRAAVAAENVGLAEPRAAGSNRLYGKVLESRGEQNDRPGAHDGVVEDLIDLLSPGERSLMRPKEQGSGRSPEVTDNARRPARS